MIEFDNDPELARLRGALKDRMAELREARAVGTGVSFAYGHAGNIQDEIYTYCFVKAGSKRRALEAGMKQGMTVDIIADVGYDYTCYHRAAEQAWKRNRSWRDA